MNPADRVGQPELGILLDQVRDLITSQIRADNVGVCLTDFQQIGTELGHVGGDEFIANQLAAILVEESLGCSSEVVTENVIGRERVELLILHHVVAYQSLADSV